MEAGPRLLHIICLDTVHGIRSGSEACIKLAALLPASCQSYQELHGKRGIMAFSEGECDLLDGG